MLFLREHRSKKSIELSDQNRSNVYELNEIKRRNSNQLRRDATIAFQALCIINEYFVDIPCIERRWG